jgi:hypothetical protein
MANKSHFLTAFEKVYFDGLVVEGKYLRQSSLYKQILPRTPSRLKTSVFSVPSVANNLFNRRNPRLINDLRLRKITYEKIYLFMQNKANFRKSQMNVSDFITRDYDKMDTWSSGKNKANSNPIQTQFKANTKPIQTQYKPKQTQTNPISNIAFTRQPACLYAFFQDFHQFAIGQ